MVDFSHGRHRSATPVSFLEPSQTVLAGDEMSFLVFDSSSKQGYSDVRPSLLTKDGRVPYDNSSLCQLGWMVYPGFLVKRPKACDTQVVIPAGPTFANRCRLPDSEILQLMEARNPDNPFGVTDGGVSLFAFLIERRFQAGLAATITTMYLASYLQSLAEDAPVLAINRLEATSVRYLREVLVQVAHNALDLAVINPAKWEELASNYSATLIGDAGGTAEGPFCNTVVTTLLTRGNRRTSPPEAWSEECYLAPGPSAPSFVFNLEDADGIHAPAILSIQGEHTPRSFQDLNLGRDRARLASIRHQGYGFALTRAPEIAEVLRQQDDSELFGPAGPMLALPMAIAKVLDHHHPGIGFLDHLKVTIREHQAVRFEVHEPIERKLLAGVITFLNTTENPAPGLHNLDSIAYHIAATEGVTLEPKVLSRKLNRMRLLVGKKVRKRVYSAAEATKKGWNCFYKLNLAGLNDLAQAYQLDLSVNQGADAAAALVAKHVSH